MNVILFMIAIVVLLFSLSQLTRFKDRKDQSVLREMKKNIRLLLYGIPVLVALAFIPYQAWVITGKLNGWGGMYIVGGRRSS